MENSPSLEDFRHYTEGLQKAGADRHTVEVAQKALAVFDWFEERLDALDNREGD